MTAPSRTCITKSAVSTHLLPRPRPSFTPPLASSPWKLLIALRQPGIGNQELSGLPASARALKGVMQRAPSHSLTQRDARCTVLPRRSRPTNPRSDRPTRAPAESLALACRRDRQPASSRSLDPGRPERRLEVSIRTTPRSAALPTLSSPLVTIPRTLVPLGTRALVSAPQSLG